MSSTCQVNNIDIDLIYSNTIEENIISINTKKELFFDVYECVVNNKKLILEKVGESDLGPKVLLEINIEGKKYSAEAVLVDNGSTYVELNKENIYFIRTIPEETHTIEEEEEVVEVNINEDESSDNIEVNYENIIEHHVNNKLVFLHELEEQFEEKIVSLKDDISNKLDLFFEKLEDKKKVIVEEKLEKITANLDEKFTTLQSELQGVEDFSKKNIDKILENKIIEIDNSVSLFLEGITKEYKNKIISSDKKITHNFLELNSIKEKLKENNNTTNKKFDELNSLKVKLLEQDELVLKNEELKKFINEEFKNIDSKFKNLSEEESKKYDELLAAVNNKDVVEYKTILKEKIQDVELTQIKESLQEEISSALKGDIVSLKRYVEMSSGGGSVAKQFAAGGTMDGTLNVNGNILSGGTNLIDIFNSDTSINLQDVTDNGNTTTNIISSNNTIIADTILATNLLSATNLDIGFELSGFNVTGNLSASGNISSGSLTTPALSTDGIDAKFTDNVIIAGDLDIGFPNENEDQCITIHSSNSSGKRTILKQTGSAFSISPLIGNQCLILGSGSNNITCICGNASHELRIPTSKVNIGTTGGTEKLTVAGNISASGNLSGANIVGNNVFSGGLAVCTSQTTPTLQAVTNEGNSTTDSINVGSCINFGDRYSNDTLIKVESDSHDITLIRAASTSDAVGVSLKYNGSGNGDENIFEIATDGGGSLKIDNSGDVGINTAPVDGIDLAVGTFTSSGNVGIGTATPSEKLEVDGNLMLQQNGVIKNNNNNTQFRFDPNAFYFDNGHIRAGYSVGVRGNKGNQKGMDQGSTTSDLGLYCGSNEAISIHSDGDTRINNALEVEGTTTVGKITLSDNSFVAETSSFTLGSTHRGATVLLQNTAPITITVPSQVAGHTTTFIAETSNAVVFTSGTGLSAFNSFNSANQIAGIFGQAQIIFKSSTEAFLGGNVI